MNELFINKDTRYKIPIDVETRLKDLYNIRGKKAFQKNLNYQDYYTLLTTHRMGAKTLRKLLENAESGPKRNSRLAKDAKYYDKKEELFRLWEKGITISKGKTITARKGEFVKKKKIITEVVAVQVEPYQIWIDSMGKLAKPLDYVDIYSLLPIFESALRTNKSILLVGGKGIGKTLSVRAFAMIHQIPLIEASFSSGTQKHDLVGSYALVPAPKKGSSKGSGQVIMWKPGILQTAIEVANKNGKAILFLDEIAALSPQVQKLLNPMTDFRKEIIVPEIGWRCFLNSGKQLLVIGAANPWWNPSYRGQNPLNPDLRSRFSIQKPLFIPNKQQLQRIFKRVEPEVESMKKQLLNAMDKYNKSHQSGEGVEIEPRLVRSLLQTYKHYLAEDNNPDLQTIYLYGKGGGGAMGGPGKNKNYAWAWAYTQVLLGSIMDEEKRNTFHQDFARNFSSQTYNTMNKVAKALGLSGFGGKSSIAAY
tara:strand:- start:1226 stop:2656 length:1431 start_codon:yes stop_codon:yes gene_type:complete